MQSQEIRSRFLEFFKKRAHTVLPSAPLVPENDPSVLFNTAGMQPLVPYLLGTPHPSGSRRLASVQKCVRTGDIEEVGDNTHLTFFEMLGNWSLGDYFKKEAIEWSYEFLTSPEEGLGLDPERLYVTVFEGDANAPRDEEAYALWKALFEQAGLDPAKRIFFLGAENNWWSPGDNGPSGPDTEMFYDVTGTLTEGLSKEQFLEADEKQEVVEIWNDVFMEYRKENGTVVGKLETKNVDTGTGLERAVTVAQGKQSIYDTDLFMPLLEVIRLLEKQSDVRKERIVADHIRAAVFLIGDGISPSNTDQGYVLRRLVRRAIRFSDDLGMPVDTLKNVAETVIQHYGAAYPELPKNSERILTQLSEEEQKFRETLEKGLKQFEKMAANGLDGQEAFILFSTYGFPIELTEELAKEQGIAIDRAAFNEELAKHQDLSRTASAGKFKGGLADHSEKVTALHTATHLMLAALRKELGNDVHQAGSNITEERTRFDFTYPEKVPRPVLEQIEHYVNSAIQAGAHRKIVTMGKDEAQAKGVEGSFWEKYPEQVSVYEFVGPDGTIYSQELCGGPHVENTGSIAQFGSFQIIKEEASSRGIRRIKAVLA